LNSSNCGLKQLDHAVVVVGYYPGSTAEPTTPTEPTEPTITTITETICKRARRQRRRRRRRRCNARKGWYPHPDRRGWCCKDIETEVIDNGDGGSTEVSEDAYFLVQNSWGTGWGENGFAKMAVEMDTAGACGMNTEPFTVVG